MFFLKLVNSMATKPIIWVLWRENLIMLHANNKCVDQSAHLCMSDQHLCCSLGGRYNI